MSDRIIHSVVILLKDSLPVQLNVSMATTSDTPTHEWPVYIDHPRLDSRAMYSAYVKVADQSQPWFGKLSLELHASPNYKEPMAPVAACFKAEPCVEPDCFRCKVKQGGYKLKWFHPLWKAEYLANKAKEAWDPDETEKVRQDRDIAFQAARELHQQEMRPRMESFLSALEANDGSMRAVVLEMFRKKTGDSR